MAGPLISFLTDFGGESAPATCRGVMWGIAPDARLLDLNHQVPKFAVRDGAFLLSRAVGYLPVGVHLAVVDPGVGTARRPSPCGPPAATSSSGRTTGCCCQRRGCSVARTICPREVFVRHGHTTHHRVDVITQSVWRLRACSRSRHLVSRWEDGERIGIVAAALTVVGLTRDGGHLTGGLLVCGKVVRMSGKRQKYTPEFREQAARLVIETGRLLRMWRLRLVSANNCWGVGCVGRGKRPRLAILAWCSMPTNAHS